MPHTYTDIHMHIGIVNIHISYTIYIHFFVRGTFGLEANEKAT